MAGLELAIFRLWAGFELSTSRLQNAIYFSIIVMPEKSHFTIFTIQNIYTFKHSIYIFMIMFVHE